MANLPEKNIATVSAITSIPSNTNIFVNANGQFGQANIDDVVKASNVVSDATLNAMKEFIDNQFQVLTGSPILVQGTEDGYMPSFTGKGGSSQKSYSGYQLLDYDAWSKSSITNGSAIFENNGITLISTNGDCYVNAIIEIPVSEGETINISWEEDTNAQGLIYIFGNGSTEYRANINNANGKQLQYTIPTGVTFVTFRFGVLNSNTTISYKNIMINKGDTVLPFEPYVGAQPSPNPPYPQPIKSKGDCGWFDGELLQGAYASATGAFVSTVDWISNKNIIPCKEDDSITVSYDENCECGILYYDSDMNYLTYKKDADISSLTSIAPTNAKYFNFSIGVTGITPSTAKKIVVTINGMYAVAVKTQNKNVAIYPMVEVTGINSKGEITDWSGYIGTRLYIPVKEKTEYIYSSSLDSNLHSIVFYDKERNIILIKSGYFNNVFTTPENTRYVRYSMEKADLPTWEQLEQGTEATDYQPYQETINYIPISEPLRENDTIECIDGVYGVVRGRDKTRLKPEIDWYKTGTNVDRYWTLLAALGIDFNNVENILCTHFSYNDSAEKVGLFTVNTTSRGIGFAFAEKDTSTVDDFTTFLIENEIYVEHNLATPTFEPFTDQSPFYNLKTFEGATHISASDDMEMTVEVPTSRAGGVASIGWSKGNLAQIETQNLSAKIAELQTAIVNS